MSFFTIVVFFYSAISNVFVNVNARGDLSLIVTNSSMDWVEIPILNATLKIIAGGESKLKATQIEVFIKPPKNFHCGDTKKSCGGCIGVGHTHCHLEWFDIDVF